MTIFQIYAMTILSLMFLVFFIATIIILFGEDKKIENKR